MHANLHIVNKINSTLEDIWCEEFMHTRFISLEDLNSADLPMYPDDFEKFLQKKCLQQRELLEKNWIPKCAKVLINLKKYWEQLVPKDEEASLQPPMRFYNCVATLMSNQLRNLVVDSLAEFVSFFEQYQVKLELIYVNFELFSILCFNLKGRKQI